MNHLHRELAPIAASGWEEIDKEATRTLKTSLGGRRVVDFVGPKGWDHGAVATGRTESVAPPVKGKLQARLRQVLPLVELRVPFEIERAELDAISRGAKDPDTDPVIAAAREIAIAENRLIFHGYGEAGIRGICEGGAAQAVPFSEDFTTFPNAVAGAKTRLRDGGVDGPYAVALSERAYTALSETTDGGYPVLEHMRRLVDGPLVWTPGLDGAVVLSLRGGDFELTVGQDFSIGYLSHDERVVRLYIEESVTFWLLSDQAGVPLTRGSGERKK